MDKSDYYASKLGLQKALEACEAWADEFLDCMEGEDLPGFVEWEALYQVALNGQRHVKAKLAELEAHKDEPEEEFEL